MLAVAVRMPEAEPPEFGFSLLESVDFDYGVTESPALRPVASNEVVIDIPSKRGMKTFVLCNA